MAYRLRKLMIVSLKQKWILIEIFSSLFFGANSTIDCLTSNFFNLGICLVEGESQFNSSAVGSMNWDGSQDYGLFQISEKYWCLPGERRTTGCKLKCEGKNIDLRYVTR